LQAAEKGFKRLMEAGKILTSTEIDTAGEGSLDKDILEAMEGAFADMDDDF
jgi:hypothetical protein